MRNRLRLDSCANVSPGARNAKCILCIEISGNNLIHGYYENHTQPRSIILATHQNDVTNCMESKLHLASCGARRHTEGCSTPCFYGSTFIINLLKIESLIDSFTHTHRQVEVVYNYIVASIKCKTFQITKDIKTSEHQIYIA